MIQTIEIKPVDWSRAKLSLEKIENIMLDWKLYPRKEIDQKVVATYAKAILAGAMFPPIKVGLINGRKILVDGAHRTRARTQLKMEHIDCLNHRFESEAVLFAEAVRCNSSHGKNYTSDEVADNIRRLKKYKFDPSEIQKIVHVPASEFTREYMQPILSVTLPNGTKKPCIEVKPGEPGVQGILCLKNALIVVCHFAEANKIPEDPPIPELVQRAMEALKRVNTNNVSRSGIEGQSAA